jgi:hypothetical protein
MPTGTKSISPSVKTAYMREYRARNREILRAYEREYRKKNPKIACSRGMRTRAKLRKQILNAYGNACACCGETTVQFLSLDHIHGDGAAHRREFGYKQLGSGGGEIYREVAKLGFPKDRFQLLCMSCNHSHGRYGYCPHKGRPTEPLVGRKKWNRTAKQNVITAYGGKCVCCDETALEFLSIDHINGQRRADETRHKGTYFYLWLKQQGYPKDIYQLLCMNCNFAEGHGGCPHKCPHKCPQQFTCTELAA